jgi:hypothetical protein
MWTTYHTLVRVSTRRRVESEVRVRRPQILPVIGVSPTLTAARLRIPASSCITEGLGTPAAFPGVDARVIGMVQKKIHRLKARPPSVSRPYSGRTSA